MTATDAPTVSYDSIDDYLGPSPRRFFGDGYRRIGYGLYDIENTEHESTRTTSAHAALSYPDDWSQKATGNQRPHLSTIDALLIAGTMAGLFADHLPAALGEQCDLPASDAWIERMRIRAGSSPHEDMSDIPVTTNSTVIEPLSSNDIRSRHTTTLGGMTVRTDVVHPAVAAASPSTSAAPGNGMYFDRLRDHTVALHDVDVHPGPARADATIDITTNGDTAAAPAALAGRYTDALSPTDAFVSTLQLGQVLLYELDDLTRADSNTLWMRQTVIDVGSPVQPATEPIGTGTHLEDVRLLERPDGTWRAADIVGVTSSTTVRCSVAHLLP